MTERLNNDNKYFLYLIMVRGIKQVLEDIKYWIQVMLMLFFPRKITRSLICFLLKSFQIFYYDKIYLTYKFTYIINIFLHVLDSIPPPPRELFIIAIPVSVKCYHMVLSCISLMIVTLTIFICA